MLTTYNCTFCEPRESTTGKCSVLVQYRCRDSISGVEPNVSVVGTVPLQPLQITHSHTHTLTPQPHTHTQHTTQTHSGPWAPNALQDYREVRQTQTSPHPPLALCKSECVCMCVSVCLCVSVCSVS